MDQHQRDRRLIALAVLAILCAGVYVVVEPFFAAVAWAIVLVLATWPLYRRMRRLVPRFPSLSALVMTLLLALFIIIPVGALLKQAAEELQTGVEKTQAWLAKPDAELPPSVAKIPWIGADIVKRFNDAADKRQQVAEWFRENRPELVDVAKGVVGRIAGGIFKVAMCLFCAFFFYLHGDTLAAQVQRVAIRVGGSRFSDLLRTTRATVRAAVYGVLLTALAQGALAGIGFFVADTPVPLLLALFTVVASLIPFGPPVIYLGAAGALLAQGAPWWHAALLAGWGLGIVSSADNVIRPVFISQATQTPLLVVFLGVIGGLVAFGLIGVVIGPVILTVASVLWKEWAQPDEPASIGG